MTTHCLSAYPGISAAISRQEGKRGLKRRDRDAFTSGQAVSIISVGLLVLAEVHSPKTCPKNRSD
ncbi:MAG: hypothetical protein LBU38_05245 [Propionibacteriaceae bacterium]|jgi:hypothetical protein|nr:hypothetical protein [Propionibacteriaceae bacterium]